MKITGKILFFNADTGEGMIITSNKTKLKFSVADWDDFDTMPSLGLEVRFLHEANSVSSIVSINYVEEEPQEEEFFEEEDEAEAEEEYYEEEDEVVESITEEAKESLLEDFEADTEITKLATPEDFEEEIGQREESVTVTMNLSKAVSNYFDIINENIQKRVAYKKVKGRLDYLAIRRFLWTTFNNLSEIDLHIITPKIKSLSDDLREMASVYNDFVRKTKYPPLAYEEVFLSCQAEYKIIREGAEKTIERLNQLKGSEKHLGSSLKIKKAELSSEINTDEFDLLENELKSLNGTYVDVVHMMAELDERYKHDMKLLTEFEKEYRTDFYELFEESAKKYKKDIVDILSAQAFTLDANLWSQAKSSKAIKAHFHKAGINGEFNTRTYLKYYLDTQDSSKATEENKKLFKLHEYLISLEKENIMIVLNDANDAIEFESMINRTDKAFFAKSFIDERMSLKWAIRNSIQVLILENDLTKMHVESYLSYYKKYVLVIPKIILLGNLKKSDEYTIHKLLPRGVSAAAVAKNVKELLSK